MSTIKVNVDGLVAAVKKAQLAAKDGYMMSVDPSRKNADGKASATITSCDGNTQIVAHFFAEIVDGDGKPFSVCTGLEFANVVMTLAELKKEITLSVTDAGLKVCCNGSEACVDLKAKIELFEIINSKDRYCVQLSAKTFKEAVSKGGYRPCKDDSRGFKNMIQLIPICTTPEEACLRVVTTDGSCIAVCDGKVAQITAQFNDYRAYGIACDRLVAVANVVSGEEVNVFFTSQQVVVSSGNDFFIFRTFAASYPESIGKLIEHKISACSVKVAAKELDTALALTMITNGDSKPVALELDDGALVVSDSFAKSRTRLSVQVSGDIEKPFCCSAAYLRTAIAKTGTENVVLRIDDWNKPMYVNGDVQEYAVGIVFPVCNNSESKSDSKSE